MYQGGAAKPSSETDPIVDQSADTENTPNPYRALQAFHSEHERLFFGRADDVARLAAQFKGLHELVDDRPNKVRLLTLIGPSGCGKSSLLRAGLLPALQREPIDDKPCRVVVLTPGEDPVYNLAAAVAAIGGHKDDATARLERGQLTEQIFATLNAAEGGSLPGLKRLAHHLPGDQPSRLVVAFDQFEELYTLAPQETRKHLVATLIEACAQPGGDVSAILSFRSDFLEQTIGEPELNHLITGENAYLVTMLSQEGMRAAIEEPAKAAGRPFDRALVERLLNEMEDQVGALPALQFTLARLWEAWPQKPEERLAELGGVAGALASISEAVFTGLPPAEQDIARRVFLATVRLGKGTRDTRRDAAVREIVGDGETREQVLGVLRSFARADRRLVTLHREAKESRVRFTVAHETLFSAWERLRAWIEDHREDLAIYRKIAEAAEEWDEAGRPSDRLATGANLAQLKAFMQKQPIRFSTIQSRFARRSVLRKKAWQAVGAAIVATIAGLVSWIGLIAHEQWRDARPWGRVVQLSTGEAQDLQGRIANVGRPTTGLENFRPDVEFDRRTVSRWHMQINRNGFALDLRSTYGTTVNGRFVHYGQEFEVENGDLFVLGGGTPILFERYAWNEFIDWLIPPDRSRTLPKPCGWGVLIVEEGNTARFVYLNAEKYGVRMTDGHLLLDEAKTEEAQIVITRFDTNQPLSVNATDGKADFVVLNTASDKLYAVPLSVLVQEEAPGLFIDLKSGPYDNLKIAPPIGLPITHVLPRYPAEERYRALDAKFLSFVLPEVRFQVVPFDTALRTCPS